MEDSLDVLCGLYDQSRGGSGRRWSLSDGERPGLVSSCRSSQRAGGMGNPQRILCRGVTWSEKSFKCIMLASELRTVGGPQWKQGDPLEGYSHEPGQNMTMDWMRAITVVVGRRWWRWWEIIQVWLYLEGRATRVSWMMSIEHEEKRVISSARMALRILVWAAVRMELLFTEIRKPMEEASFAGR